MALKFAKQIVADIGLLRTHPWPASKVKKLRGREYWELKSGDYRSILWLHGNHVVVLRIVNRSDLERTIGRIDMRALVQWIRQLRSE
jgi:mRNA-degrading endonuclease RelE of RelBE toxin-antitoxin system